MKEIKPEARKKPSKRKHLGLAPPAHVDTRIEGTSAEEVMLLRHFRTIDDDWERAYIIDVTRRHAEAQEPRKAVLTVIK
jgi:hypothetical protein